MRILRWGSLWLVGAAAACGGGGPGPGPSPSQVTATAGENQVGAAGQPLGAALEVTVKDGSGTPLSSITVNWAVASGGGSVNPASNATGADGKATATRTLGAGAGAQTATATVSGVTPATFHHIAQIQGATQMQASGSAARADTVKATVAPLIVLVADQNSLPKQGVIVTWSVSGGGSISQAVDTTDANGFSSVTWTFDSISGSKTVQAAVTGLQGSPVAFSATVAAGNATEMALNGGDAQAGPVGTALPAPHTVIVRDAYGNPKSALPVTWVLGVGGGSLSTTTPITDGSGIASVVRTLGAAVGLSSDTAKLVGLTGSPVAFTDTAGPVDTINVRNNFFAPTPDTVTAGTFLKFVWQGGVPHSVDWLSGPTPRPANSATQSSGTYLARLTKPGTYGYECGVHGAVMSGVVVVQ